MTSHHAPPEPGSVRSIVAPHMACLGGTRGMLLDDMRLAATRCGRAEADLVDAIKTWRAAHGPQRVMWRKVARFALGRLRRLRVEARAAWRRLAAHNRSKR